MNITTVWRLGMIIDKKAQQNRYNRRHNLPRRGRADVLRAKRLATVPALSFCELIIRLSRGRLDSTIAGELLRIDADHISLDIRIDRETGQVGHWSLRTKSAATSDAKIGGDEIAPAA